LPNHHEQYSITSFQKTFESTYNIDILTSTKIANVRFSAIIV